MISEVSRVGKRGTVVIPAGLRRRFNMTDGSFVMAEERPDGILLRSAAVLPIESYSSERKAEFLLSTATNASDYADAIKLVRSMGIDPAGVTHRKPGGV